LLYGKGGLAWVKNDVQVITNNFQPLPPGPYFVTRQDDWKIGWTLGLGVEQALTQGLSMKVEYEYLGFGSTDIITPETTPYFCFPCVLGGDRASFDSQMQLVQVGLNYKLGADPLAAFDGTGIPFHNGPEGWSFEFGARAWASIGKFQWDHGVPPPSG